MRKIDINRCLVALLIVGGAISLFSCKDHSSTIQSISTETLMSESSDTLTVIVTENGRPSYRFYAPLVEGYSLAREPYREFRRGVNIVTYIDDSLSMVDATLTSNYAIYYSNLKLWEAKGDVVVIKHDGKELYTQQLFWNSTTKRIYSNVDTKIVDTASDDVYFGEGFESDEDMKQWSFRKMKGTMKVDTTPTEPVVDSLSSVEATEPIENQKASEATPSEEMPNSSTSMKSAAEAAAASVADSVKVSKKVSHREEGVNPMGVSQGVDVPRTVGRAPRKEAMEKISEKSGVDER
ncbi:MAG: LPS export ABC transporter periplasmic protein LptC [Rikenellaceae bacterium]